MSSAGIVRFGNALVVLFVKQFPSLNRYLCTLFVWTCFFIATIWTEASIMVIGLVCCGNTLELHLQRISLLRVGMNVCKPLNAWTLPCKQWIVRAIPVWQQERDGLLKRLWLRDCCVSSCFLIILSQLS